MVATSPLAALMGGGGDPPTRNLSQEAHLYARDVLTGLVGKGVTDFKDQEAKNAYSYLKGALGNSMATKLMTQVISYNGRNDVKNLPADRKVQTFYDMGSNDPETHSMMMRMRSLGTGPVGGLGSSPDLQNMISSKRDTTAGPGAGRANLQPITAATAGIR